MHYEKKLHQEEFLEEWWLPPERTKCNNHDVGDQVNIPNVLMNCMI